LLSGYRDKTDLTPKFTTNYARIYQEAEGEPGLNVRNKFRIVLPFSGIKSARLYDLTIDPATFVDKAGRLKKIMEKRRSSAG
jgi:hypothetical protein